jgi:hypothetical protein
VQEVDGAVRVRVAGADEQVALVGWADAAEVHATVRAGGAAAAPTTHRVEVVDGGRWELRLTLPAEPGWATVELTIP